MTKEIRDRKLAIVIGASGEIGSALSMALTSDGCRVVGVARRLPGLQRVSDIIGDSFYCYSADFTKEADVMGCFRSIIGKHGRPDFVIHTAAITPDPDTPLAELSLAGWQRTFDTYVTGLFLCVRESLRSLEAGAHILAVSSAVTRIPGDQLPPGFHVGHYAAAKSAVDELCKWARREAHERGILLSRLAPGAVDTPFHRNAPPHRRPAAMLSLSTVAEKVTSALRDKRELDEILVARSPNSGVAD